MALGLTLPDSTGLETLGAFLDGLDEAPPVEIAPGQSVDVQEKVFLPGEILRVHYEDVVEDLDSQVRRLLDFCGLPFEDACLDFHQTDRAVRTASSEQVRQPIFTSGVEQWRHFEPHLEPLKHALGESLTAYRT